MDARTLGSDAHGTVHGARAGTRRGTRVVNLSDAVDEPVVVDAPLAPVVPELVVQVAFRGVLRRYRELRDASRTVRQQQQRQEERQPDERDLEAAERTVPVAHGGQVTRTDINTILVFICCASASVSSHREARGDAQRRASIRTLRSFIH